MLLILGRVIVLVELVVLELIQFWDLVIESADSSISVVLVLILLVLVLIVYLYNSIIVIRIYR